MNTIIRASPLAALLLLVGCSKQTPEQPSLTDTALHSPARTKTWIGSGPHPHDTPLLDETRPHYITADWAPVCVAPILEGRCTHEVGYNLGTKLDALPRDQNEAKQRVLVQIDAEYMPGLIDANLLGTRPDLTHREAFMNKLAHADVRFDSHHYEELDLERLSALPDGAQLHIHGVTPSRDYSDWMGPDVMSDARPLTWRLLVGNKGHIVIAFPFGADTELWTFPPFADERANENGPLYSCAPPQCEEVDGARACEHDYCDQVDLFLQREGDLFIARVIVDRFGVHKAVLPAGY